MDLFASPSVRAAEVGATHPLASILAGREDVFTMTEQAENAALVPDEPGGLSYGERAAFACRIARLNDEPRLAAHFERRMAVADMAGSALADPAFDGKSDDRMAALLRHIDLVTRSPKAVVAADIDALKRAGISEDDIVRLSQLVAFVNYEARVCRGLRLLARAS